MAKSMVSIMLGAIDGLHSEVAVMLFMIDHIIAIPWYLNGIIARLDSLMAEGQNFVLKFHHIQIHDLDHCVLINYCVLYVDRLVVVNVILTVICQFKRIEYISLKLENISNLKLTFYRKYVWEYCLLWSAMFIQTSECQYISSFIHIIILLSSEPWST